MFIPGQSSARAEDRGQYSDNRSQLAGDRGQYSDNRSQHAGDRGQYSGDHRQFATKNEFKVPNEPFDKVKDIYLGVDFLNNSGKSFYFQLIISWFLQNDLDISASVTLEEIVSIKHFKLIKQRYHPHY